MYRVLACLLCLPLGACGFVGGIQAGANYRKSSAEYRECLASAPNAQACERQRLLMEADERVDANLNNPGATLNANIRNR